MREVGANGEVVDALEIELIAPEREVVVAEERDERLEVVAVRADGVDRHVALVRQVIEEITDLVLHTPPPHTNECRTAECRIQNEEANRPWSASACRRFSTRKKLIA